VRNCGEEEGDRPDTTSGPAKTSGLGASLAETGGQSALRRLLVMKLRFLPAAAAVLLFGCSRSNNLLLGRVEATVGTHTVVVTDCYRTEAPQPEKLADEGGQSVYRYMPCRDATSGFAAAN